ncbi:flagellar hook-associated protein FlgK [Bacillus sp. FJAT-44742]|uniref:flagellar hook-associated protein FlgK n=1 Tax=Bacillus sp. FJAT-44742 TaxID=2014005 RepID=UPI000C2433BE|nr:flagellar hook-associated protein FlgK [Bacillus sp. FJAT-44742]
MTSTFHGLETARRAMTTQQTALYTTGHNIANANTPGYTRQRVNFSATEPMPPASLNAPRIPGQIGTGVEAGSVQRVQEHFLNVQYHGESAKAGYWDSVYTSLEKMEDIMNEPTEDGINQTLDRFWNSLQDLNANPQDSGARAVVRQNGIAVAEVFNYTADSLKAIQRDIKADINTTTNQVNSLLQQINEINKQVSSMEPHGYLPNDLYDERDRLIDELSAIANIQIEKEPSGGQAKSSAEGSFTIYLADGDGNQITKLVDGANHDFRQMQIQYDSEDRTAPVSAMTLAWDNGDWVDGEALDGPINDLSFLDSPGKMKGLVAAYGYMENGEVRGTYPDMLTELDLMVTTFVEAFNEVHEAGWTLNDIRNEEKGEPISFFTFAEPTANKSGASQLLQISDEIKNSLNHIAAAAPTGNPAIAFAGDGSNALALANVKDLPLDFGGNDTNVQSFYQSIIGDMAVATNEANRMKNNSAALRDNIDHRRQSVSSVSLDEEMTNMIQFQHAYNAAARNITTIDEMLDRIINGMGIVGR